MKVCHIPLDASKNQQFQIMKEAIVSCGFELSENNSIKDVMACDIVHFNWYENIRKGMPAHRFLQFAKKMATLKLLRAMGKKIVLTMHNKVPHDDAQDGYSKRILEWLILNSDKIVIHCKKASKEYLHHSYPNINMDKVCYVPLANNIDTYPDEREYKGFDKKEEDIVLLFVGMVRPYKNVEVIIDVANELQQFKNLKFLICGMCSSEKYKAEVVNRIKSKNICCDFRFIPDGEMPSLLRLSDAILLPYGTESALNSGAAYLAFSYGRTVVSTDIGTLQDFPNDLVYSYSYNQESIVHKQNLKAAILKLYDDFTNNHDAVMIKGRMLKDIVVKENSPEKIVDSLKLAYKF